MSTEGDAVGDCPAVAGDGSDAGGDGWDPEGNFVVLDWVIGTLSVLSGHDCDDRILGDVA